MWQVVDRTPFSAQGYPVRNRDGVEHWAVALRARFDVRPDGPYAFRLPQIIAEARTRIGREDLGTRLRLISANVDGTARTVDLTWNASVPCHGRDHHVRGSTVSIRQMAGVAR